MSEEFFSRQSTRLAIKAFSNFRSNYTKYIIKRIGLRPRSLVFLAIIDNKIEFVIKLTHSGHSDSTLISIDKWAEVDTPILPILKVGKVGNYDYIITKYINLREGIQLEATDKTRFSLAEDLGKIMSQMHNAKGKGYGKILLDGNGEYNSFNEFIYEYFITASNALFKSDLISKRYSELAIRIAKYLNEKRGTVSPSFLHTDLYIHNVFVNHKSKIQYVFDPNPLIFDPLLDIAYTKTLLNFFDYYNNQKKNITESKKYEKEYYLFLENYLRNSISEESSIKETDKIATCYEYLILIQKLYWYSLKNSDSLRFLVKENLKNLYKEIRKKNLI